MIRYYNPLPAWDYWRVIYDDYFAKTLGYGIFLHPHNEHRIVFPEMVYQLDLLFRGRLILPVVFSFLCYFSVWIVLAQIFWRDRTLSLAVRMFGALVAGIILGWQGAAVVIGDPFLLQWTLSSLCVLLSMLFVAQRALPGAMIVGVIATYSSGNCLLLWPVVLLEAWLLRATRRQFVIILTTAIVAIAVYFIGYHPNSKIDWVQLLSHPLQLVGFVLTFISMPFGLSRYEGVAILLGSINLLAAILIFADLLRKRMFHEETVVLLFSAYLFVLLTAILISIGRVNVAGFGEAKASRYWAIPLINWADVGLLCIYFNSKANVSFKVKAGISAAVVIALALAAIKLRSTLLYDDDQFAKRQLAALSFENGLEDTGLTRRIFPDPNFVFSLIRFLQEHQLSIYSLRTFHLLGEPLQTAGTIVNQVRSGGVISTLSVEGGLEVIGWAEPERNGAEQIVFADQKGDIVGFGKKLPAGFPVDLQSPAIPVSDAWVGFVNLRYGPQSLWPFFWSRGRLQPIGGAIPIDTTLRRVSQETGPLLASIQWQMDAAWTRNGFPAMEYMSDPPHAAIYSSWSGKDSNKGQIASSPFPSPSTGCLLIPTAHGPFVDGLSVEISNADTGQIIKTIPMQNGDLGWQFWALTIEKSVLRIRLVAKDEGSDWGEWLAIAQPSQCASVTQ